MPTKTSSSSSNWPAAWNCLRIRPPRSSARQPKPGDGLEAAARNERYEFLETYPPIGGPVYRATAHTADDQAETILHRIVRGTGVAGLAGMARAAHGPRNVDPSAAGHAPPGIGKLPQRGSANPVRHDASNTDVRFMGNWIRHETLPQLRTKSMPTSPSLCFIRSLAGEAQAVIDELVEELFARCVAIEAPIAAQIELGALSDRRRIWFANY